MFADEDLIMISSLQHLIFCERQFALIHLEQSWEDNFLTAKGDVFHERVDNSPSESRPDCKIVRRLRLCSKTLGIYGVADVVEFHLDLGSASVPPPSSAFADLTPLGIEGSWRPFPVEYKRGRPKEDLSDSVQLCAQALCLEEMLGVSLREGSLFYGETKRRFPVLFDASLRQATHRAISRAHEMLASGRTPPAHYESKCLACSLLEVCKPNLPQDRLGRYLKQLHEPGAE